MKKCVIDIETENLEPWLGRIICIGIRDVDSNKTRIFFDEDEKSLLYRFMSTIGNNASQRS